MTDHFPGDGEMAAREAAREAANGQLQEDAAERAMQAEALQSTAGELEERTEAAEAAAGELAEREARYRSLAETVPVQVWTAAPDGRLDYVSERTAAYFGVPTARVLGEGWTQFVHPDDLAAAAARWTTALETGAPYEVEFRLRGADGRYRWHLGRATSRLTADGSRTGWVGTNTDIEGLRAARAAAEEAGRQVTAVLESISDAFFALDRAWCFTYVNDRAEDLLQRPREALVGRNLWAEFGPAIGTTFEHEYRRAMATRQAVAFVEWYAPLARWFEVRAYPGPGGLAVYFQDVTARKQAEAERERLLAESEAARQDAEALQRRAEAAQHQAELAQREAEAANRAKSDFLATMSHEIRTPINAVLGYADLMDLGVAGPLTEQQRDYLARLTASGRHLLGLVNEVLDLARVEAGHLAVAHERVELPAAVEAALALVGPQAAARGLAFEYTCRLPAGTAFVGDAGRVRQVVVNLLSNAVKFTDPAAGDAPDAPGGVGAANADDEGTVPGERPARPILVECGAASTPGFRYGGVDAAERANAWLYVRVADAGIGIPAEELERVFQPFVQVESGHTRTRGGSGLGLAISRRLARLLGGELTVESRLGEGSTFTLWLPAPVGAESAVASTLPPSSLDDALRAGLHALGEWLAHEAERVTGTFGERLRADAEVPVARTLTDIDLRNHISTFLIDIAKVLPTVAGSDEPTAAMQDGSDIQQLISERHGAQRQRLGFTEAMLGREFALLEEHVSQVISTQAPPNTRHARARGLEVLTLFIRLAGRISLRGFQNAQAAERARARRGRRVDVTSARRAGA